MVFFVPVSKVDVLKVSKGLIKERECQDDLLSIYATQEFIAIILLVKDMIVIIL